MFTSFENRVTYFGTLDDVVQRYPWDAEIDTASIRQQLITAAIYNKKILVNDGYLVTNERLVGDLNDPGRSLIGTMLLSGTARLFARSGDVNLAEGIEKRASKIPTHDKMTKDRRWVKIRDDLEYVSKKIHHYTLSWPSGKNMGHIFYILLERIRNMPIHARKRMMPEADFRAFDDLFDHFDREISSPYDGARSIWENACWRYFGNRMTPDASLLLDRVNRDKFAGYENVRRFMNIANEVYHVAYSIGADNAIAEHNVEGIEDASIGVATALITSYPDIIGDENIGVDAQDGNVHLLNQLMLTIPHDLRFRDDFSFITSLETRGECRRARAHYLAEVREFLDGKSTFKSALQARDEFAEQLVTIIRPAVELDRTLKFTAKLLTTATKHLKGAVKNSIPGAIGYAASHFSPEFAILTPFAQEIAEGLDIALSIGIDYAQRRFVERILSLHIENALLQEGLIAAQNQADPNYLARRFGFYFGPLQQEGCRKITNLVGPHPSRVT